METVTFTLRTLTPLFLAGADQAQAELRAPTFRGLMRYWQRALIGGIVGTDANGLKKVMETETALFGATDTGSAVSIKVSVASNMPEEFTEQTSVRIGGQWQATGKGYLLWSMAKSGKADKGNLKPARWCFSPGTSFQVTLSTRGNNEQKLKQAIAAFWLLTHLGSVGSRSRRCAGSLAVQPIENQLPGISFNHSENAQALKQQLEQGLKAIRILYGNENKLEQRTIREARFDTLARNVCRIWILQDEHPWSSADIAMKEIGESLQGYRGQLPNEKRKIFGLPLMPGIRDKRRASPLLLRVTELQGNKYVGVAVLFKTTGGDVYMEDYTTIEQWTRDFPGKLEVML